MKNSLVYMYSYWMVWCCSTEIVIIQNSCNIGVANLLYPVLPVGPESYWEAPAENSRDATSGWAVGRAKDPGVKILMNWSFQERSCRWANKKNTCTYKLYMSNQKQRWHGNDLPIFKPRSSGGSKVSMEGSPHNTLLGLFRATWFIFRLR